MYVDRFACCPLVSHGEYADRTDRQTDRRTPDRYIMLSAKRGQRKVAFWLTRSFDGGRTQASVRMLFNNSRDSKPAANKSIAARLRRLDLPLLLIPMHRLIVRDRQSIISWNTNDVTSQWLVAAQYSQHVRIRFIITTRHWHRLTDLPATFSVHE